MGTVPLIEELADDPAPTLTYQATNLNTVQLCVNESELARLGHTRLFAAVQALFPVTNIRDAATRRYGSSER